ncbi:MAG: QueT transporter family protein [Clostridiaceae bacterium]|nr:QueT transporter family protein [Clostridiaceae bacterium]
MDTPGPGQSKRPGAAALVALTQSALIAALYMALTLVTPFMSFSFIQLRLAEALTALPALFPSAIAGVFAGCLLANLLNPAPLGLVDILGGSAVTLLAALLTWRLAKPWRLRLAGEARGERLEPKGFCSRDLTVRLIPLLPPVLLNALVVGSYLPFLIRPGQVSPALLAGSVGALFLSQSLVVFGIGLPLLAALKKTPWAQRVYLTEGESLKDQRRK